MATQEYYVIKRDGRKVKYNSEKIDNAISKAFLDVDNNVLTEQAKDIIHNIVNYVTELILARPDYNYKIEEIQDIVEQQLMKSEREDVAKSYILYRENRSKIRLKNTSIAKQIYDKIFARNVENSNANLDEFSFSGREQETSSISMKELALDYMSEKTTKAVKENYIYVHDLSKYIVGMHNCLFVDLDRLFKHGFITRNGDVRPPKSFEVACQQIAVIFQCQSNEQFGGTGALTLDRTLVPFVKMSFEKHFINNYIRIDAGFRVSKKIRKDLVEKTNRKALYKKYKEEIEKKYGVIEISNENLKKTKAYDYAIVDLEEEGRQGAEALYHNLNTLESRPGAQLPFTSINLGRDTSPEGRLVNKWIFNASIAGIGEYNTTSIFPISIFSYKRGVNALPGDPNYDMKKLAIKSMSKRIYPNFCNGNFSGANEDPNDPDTTFATMGCRTLIGHDINGFGYKRTGRGNLAPCTIILPKIGIEYGTCLGKRTEPDLEGFWNKLDEVLDIVRDSLLERFELMASQSPKAAPFMYKSGTMRGFDQVKDTVREALKHGTLAIGYIGIAEMCQALFGANHAESKEAYDFALKVVEHLREYCNKTTQEQKLNFTCYATPAESLCYTARNKLYDEYGEIPNVTSHEYLTNSHHIPVYQEIGVYDKLTLESRFCKFANAGCITYVELDSTFMNNLEAIEKIIDFAFSPEIDIPYLAFNFPIDTCFDCGYQNEINDECPMCGSDNIQHLRRVTGYLTTDYRKFNKGKQAEVKERVKHSI